MPILSMYPMRTASTNRKTLAALTAAICLLCASRLFAFDVSSLPLHLHLSGLKEAHAPEIVDGYLVLSAKGPYRHVGASFSFEDWSSVRSFEVNRNGVFVLAVPLPYGPRTLATYRLVLDGMWAADPANPYRQRDPSTGAAMSVVSLPERPRTVLGAWEPGGEGKATFYFEGEPGKVVTVAGTFNGWDPFIHELNETAPGRYELALDLEPGEYLYVFVYRGERIPDPINAKRAYGRDGQALSVLRISAAR